MGGVVNTVKYSGIKIPTVDNNICHDMDTNACNLGNKPCVLTALMSRDNLDFVEVTETWFKRQRITYTRVDTIHERKSRKEVRWR